MTIRTLLLYLIGDRAAILRLAQCPDALWIGLLFVFAAGFAREYDGEDLLHEPWHLFIPLGASLISSVVLYVLIRLIAWVRGANEAGFITGYRTFLTLYWLTGPLALLYAIPVERFLSAGDAMRANLALLAVVASWRVLLITRVISVLYGANFFSALFPVMLFADSVLLAVLCMTPLPLLMIMGGVRLSEPDDVLLGTTLAVGFAGYVSWLLWLFLSILVVFGPRTWQYRVPNEPPTFRAAASAWYAAVTALAAWLFVLPFTQTEQQLRHQVERHLRANRIKEALVLMSAHARADFPPHWDPPPRITRPNAQPKMIEVQETAKLLNLQPWVRQVIDEKFADSVRMDTWHMAEMSAPDVDRRLRLVHKLPKRHLLIAEPDVKGALIDLQKRTDLPEEAIQLIESLLPKTDQAAAPPQNDRDPILEGQSP